MSTATPSAARPVLHLVRDLRENKIASANLTVEDRRAVVEYYSAQGISVNEIAALLSISDRTIKRDRAEIRRANAVKPGRALADELIAELVAQADNAVERLRRAVRDNGDDPPTPHQRMRAEIHCFGIYRDLVRLLHVMGYIPTGGGVELDFDINELFHRAQRAQ